MSSNEEDLDIPQPRRARKIDEYSWKKICSKRARNIGKAYIYISLKNNSNSQRAVSPPCTYTCFGRIDTDKIKEILDNFCIIANFELQNNYLSNHANSTDVKRTRVGDRCSRKLRTIKQLNIR